MSATTVFKVKIIYKSGASMEFECLEFNIERQSGGRFSYSWKCADENVRPIMMGADEIAAVWQVGHREIEVEADQSAD